MDRLQDALEASGIKVWRDKDNLFPGSDWATEISKAITKGSLAFIACFSNASASRESSYQNEELVLAIEQFRKLPPNRQWLYPVRFDDVQMPEYSLGAGRTLDSLHRTDLFGKRRDSNLIRLVTTVAGALEGKSASPRAGVRADEALAPGLRVKQMLREPSLEIELDDLVMGVAAKIRDALLEEQFSTAPPNVKLNHEWLDLFDERLRSYQELLRPLAEILVVGGAWGEKKHGSLWSRALALVLNSRRDSGSTRLIELQDFVPLYLTYVFAMASTARDNYYGLNDFLMTPWRRLNERSPMIERLHTGLPFQSSEDWIATAVTVRAEGKTLTPEQVGDYARGREPKRYTPVSDYLFQATRPLFTALIPDEQDFDETFDLMEILLAIRAEVAKADAHDHGRYAFGAWFGRHTWKLRYMNGGPVDEVLRTYSEQKSAWTPFQQGLFRSESQIEKILPNFRDEARSISFRRG